MEKMSDERCYVKLEGDDKKRGMEELKKGQAFSLFEPDGKLIGIYIADSDAYNSPEHDSHAINCTERQMIKSINVNADPVSSLSEKDKDEMIQVDSSNIRAVRHQDGMLTVEFKSGGIYGYQRVPKETFQGLLDSKSKGKYLHKFIKPHFKCVKLLDKKDNKK